MIKLFKGKRKDNGQWIEGYLYELQPEQYMICDVNLFDRASTLPVLKFFYFCSSEVDPKTICRNTGMKDKNGKEIWENDICAAPDSMRAICKVCYGEYDNNSTNKHIGFYITWEKRWSYFRQDLGFWASRIEVIGNVFDNPELTGGAS